MSQPVSRQSQSSRDLQDLQRPWLKILSYILLVIISLIWLGEAWGRHEVLWIDRIAYPTILISTSLSMALLHRRPEYYPLAVVGTVGVLCLYTVAYLQAIIWGYIPWDNYYSLATFAQWFPLSYVILFLFLTKRQALAASLCIYGSVTVPTVINGFLERHLPFTEQKLSYLLHMVLSHLVYIVVFMVVASLQMSFVTAKLEAEKAELDHLTNLANRRSATRLLETALTQMGCEETCLGVILLDVDLFKTINDTFGHGVGDRVLIQVAQLLQQDLRKTDLSARWGGEEFIVVLTTTTPDEVNQTAERLRKQLEAYSHPEVGQVTASFGIATASCSEKLETLLQRADIAMYQAKQQGRNQVCGEIAHLVRKPEIDPTA
jgi:diguanylate cyclase (GGDEF)-like protein